MRLACHDEPSSNPQKCERRYDILNRFMAREAIGAEIGVFKGAFIDWLLKSQPAKIYVVDPWYRFAPHWDWAEGNQSTFEALMAIMNEYRSEVQDKLIEPRIEYSQEFFQLIPDNHLDWVYIDSTHGYNQTKTEMEYALKKVKETGFIMGDDYYSDPDHKHHGVYRAVKEFEAQGKIRILVDGDYWQFVVQRKP